MKNNLNGITSSYTRVKEDPIWILNRHTKGVNGKGIS